MKDKDTANISSWYSIKRGQSPWKRTNVAMPAIAELLRPSEQRLIQNGVRIRCRVVNGYV